MLILYGWLPGDAITLYKFINWYRGCSFENKIIVIQLSYVRSLHLQKQNWSLPYYILLLFDVRKRGSTLRYVSLTFMWRLKRENGVSWELKMAVAKALSVVVVASRKRKPAAMDLLPHSKCKVCLEWLNNWRMMLRLLPPHCKYLTCRIILLTCLFILILHLHLAYIF